MECMEGYIDEVYTEKSNLVFRENTGEEKIHGRSMGNRMSVLYGFFIFFKRYL